MYFVLENCDKIMHFFFNFDTCPILVLRVICAFDTSKSQRVRALFCHNSLAKVNTQLSIQV